MAKVSDFDNFGVESLSQEEHRERREYVERRCKCRECPTFVPGDGHTGFCFPLTGSSRRIQWEKECICSSCPVYDEYELTHSHYCTRCSQVCQSYKQEIGAGHE